MRAVNNVAEQSELTSEIERFPVQIEGKRAWLIVKNKQIESINWENGEKITLVDSNMDFSIEEQKEEGAELYSLAKDILAKIEAKGIRPVFSLPRKYCVELLENGLEPRPTWIKDSKILAGTIGIPYYNKEGDRIIAIVKQEVPFRDLQIRPRLTGVLPAVFQGVIATESKISPSDLIFIDTLDYKVLNETVGTLESEGDTVNRLRKEVEGKIGGL